MLKTPWHNRAIETHDEIGDIAPVDKACTQAKSCLKPGQIFHHSTNLEQDVGNTSTSRTQFNNITFKAQNGKFHLPMCVRMCDLARKHLSGFISAALIGEYFYGYFVKVHTPAPVARPHAREAKSHERAH